MGKRAALAAVFCLVLGCIYRVENAGAKEKHDGDRGQPGGICDRKPRSLACFCRRHPRSRACLSSPSPAEGVVPPELTAGGLASLWEAEAEAARQNAAEAEAEAEAARARLAEVEGSVAMAEAAKEAAKATEESAKAAEAAAKATETARAAAAEAAAARESRPPPDKSKRAGGVEGMAGKGDALGGLANRAPRSDDRPMNDLGRSRANTPTVEFDADQRRKSANYARGAKMKMRMKDYPGALEDSNRAVAADPANAEGYVRRAEVNSLLKRYGDAERDALNAIKLDAEYANGWQNLAWVRMKQKRFWEAEEAATKAIALNPKDATSRAVRAYARDMLGDRAGALSDLEAAAALDPRFRDKLAEARRGGKIYDPDQDSGLAFAVAAAAGKKSAWRLAVWAGGGLLIAGAAVFFVRRRESRPSFGFRGAAEEKMADGRLGGKYELLNVIGRGGMGTVYAATDHILGRPVAIKKVSEELVDGGPWARDMLIKEARTVASLHHPAIVEIYEIIEDSLNLYVVFELVTGKTAAQILAENGKLNVHKCLDLLRPVGEALDFAHGRGLVHRDLKPANIMATELGQVKLMDFGIARSLADAVPADGAPAQTSSAWQARTRTIVGTPAYMAPEAAKGLVSKAADIYALGVCLYELSTGRRPFPDGASDFERLTAPDTPPSALDPALAMLDALVLSALDPEPVRRPSSAGAFIAALAAAVRPGAG